MFDVNTSLIRFWEKEFSLIKPKKNKKGNRLFTPKDILTFDKIFDLVKDQGYTLEGAKLALKSGYESEQPTASDEIIGRLEQIKQRLLALR
jgi:DNA-binding transcriptional MerR regulator